MAQEFCIPRRPEDLLNPQHRGLHVREQVPFDSALANSLVNDLRFKDATRIVEQDFFDGLFSVFRNFKIVPSNFKSALCDVFNENILLMATGVELEKEPQLLERQCLKVFLFFLHWLWDVETRTEKLPLQTKKKGKGKKAAESEEWDWRRDLYLSLQNFAGVTRIENKLVSDESSGRSREREKEGESAISRLCLDMVSIALRTEEPSKVPRIREEIVKVGACCVRNLRMGETTAKELVGLLQKFEHVPEVIGEVAAKVETSGKDDMTREILKAISANTASDLSIQWDITDSKSTHVKGIAKTIDALASQVPVSLKNHWAFLTPYWDCSVHTIRSSLVSALGQVVLVESKLMGSSEKGLVDDERSLRFQQRALGILMERFLDVSPYTRARTFGVWTMLVQSKVIPIGHYVPVAEAGYRHLSDKAASVQKAAITLLKAMLEYNPFSADLRSWRFKNTLEVQSARLVEMQEDTSGNLALTQGEGEDDHETKMPGATNLEQLRGLVASLKAGLEFSVLIEKSLTPMKRILTGPSTMAAQEAIDFVSACSSFEIEGLDDAVRTMLTLIFSMEKSVQSKVVDAFTYMLIDSSSEDSETPSERRGGDPKITASNLVGLTVGATVGEMVCLEELIKNFSKRGHLPDNVAMALILIANREDNGRNAERDVPLSPRSHLVESKRARGAIQILTMGIDQWSHVLVRHVDAIIQIFHGDDVDGFALEYACTLLKEINIEPSDPSTFKSVMGALLTVILNDNMPESSWYGASTMAVDALVALFDRPEQLGTEIVQKFDFFLEEENLHVENFNGNGARMGANSRVNMDDKISSRALSRYFFIGAHVALKTIARFEKELSENQQKKQKSEGMIGGKRKSLKDNLRGEQEKENEDDLNGSSGTDWKSLELLEKIKEEWTNPGTLFGNCAARVSKFCLNLDRLLASPPMLVGSALMSLTKFMAISASYCERHLRLVFTLIRKSEVALSTRQNLIVSIQDFVKGYPNVMDPWMEHIYTLLDDPNPEFRQDCLQALVHLMLSDMIKIKGAIGKVALLLEDENHETANLAKLFFAQLAKRTVRNSNPITNLLPEILSNLLKDSSFVASSFQSTVRQLLQYTGSDKGSERLIEKICQTLKGEEDLKVWRGLIYTLRMMSMTEKGMRNFMALVSCYSHTLGDEQVFCDLTERIAKSRRSAKSGDFKEALDNFEEKVKNISGDLVAEKLAREAEETQGMEEDEIDENETSSNGGGDFMEANPRPIGSPTISLAAGIAHPPPHLKTPQPNHRGSDNEIGTVMENANEEEEEDGMSVDSPLAFPAANQAVNGEGPSGASQLQGFVRGAGEGSKEDAMDSDEEVVTDRLERMSLTPPPHRDD